MGASITIIPDFISGPQALHDRLWAELPWVKIENRPRHECWMNDFELPYTYGDGKGQTTYTPSPWHEDIRRYRLVLAMNYSINMDCCFVNGYKDGHDHLGWHADDSPEMDDSRAIVVVSVGAEREIWFRPKGQKGEATEKVLLTNGSALIMAPGMQDEYQHRIPRSSIHNCPPRISLTYRGLIKPGA